jgi:CheY-like chemotaxis protein
MTQSHVPLVIIASLSASMADSIAGQLRSEGNVVYVTHSADGCLRVATSTHPDVVLLDPGLPNRGRLEKLLKAHPFSAGAQILHMSESMQPSFRLRRAPAASSTVAGPHAA